MIRIWAFEAFACFRCKYCLLCTVAFPTVMRRTSEQLYVCGTGRNLNILDCLSGRISEFIFKFTFIQTSQMIKTIALGYCTFEQRLLVFLTAFLYIVSYFIFLPLFASRFFYFGLIFASFPTLCTNQVESVV